eukprot:GHVP01016029.1.p1 GENE.GHVP01016029.1~~GHVP01016029.1.p1  ORF type:complete len:123 (+),score=8.91 GHVP01016029.1:142-510(+)
MSSVVDKNHLLLLIEGPNSVYKSFQYSPSENLGFLCISAKTILKEFFHQTISPYISQIECEDKKYNTILFLEPILEIPKYIVSFLHRPGCLYAYIILAYERVVLIRLERDKDGYDRTAIYRD